MTHGTPYSQHPDRREEMNIKTTLRCTESWRDRLGRATVILNMSMTDIIRVAVCDYLNKKKID